ncbi:Enhancer of mRNA-decapping protein 4 [Nymphon striatum]|nr:Enhancer of mRNA-decapping protein 4 [Nymphon striatum]
MQKLLGDRAMLFIRLTWLKPRALLEGCFLLINLVREASNKPNYQALDSSDQFLQYRKITDDLVTDLKKREKTLDNTVQAMSTVLQNQQEELIKQKQVIITLNDEIKNSHVKLEKQISETISNAVSTSVQSQTSQAYRDSFQNFILPSFEKCCQNMFEQLNETFFKGTREYLLQLETIDNKRKSQDETVLNANNIQFKSIADNVQSLTLSIDAQKKKLEEVEQALSNLNLTLAMAALALLTGEGSATPVKTNVDSQVYQQQVQALINQGKVNAAFQQYGNGGWPAIVGHCTSTSHIDKVKAELYSYIMEIKRCNSKKIFFDHNDAKWIYEKGNKFLKPIFFPVKLLETEPVINQTDLLRFCSYRYLEEALVNLDLDHPTTKSYLHGVCKGLQQNFELFLKTNIDANLAKKTKKLIMITKNGTMHAHFFVSISIRWDPNHVGSKSCPTPPDAALKVRAYFLNFRSIKTITGRQTTLKALSVVEEYYRRTFATKGWPGVRRDNFNPGGRKPENQQWIQNETLELCDKRRCGVILSRAFNQDVVGSHYELGAFSLFLSFEHRSDYGFHWLLKRLDPMLDFINFINFINLPMLDFISESKANLNNGDYIQFTAFGEFASLQGDEFFANYSWIVRTIERYTNETSQPKNKNGLLPVPKPMAMAKKSASVENLSKFQNSNLNGKPPVQPLMGVPKKSANKRRDRKKKVKTAAEDCSKDNSSDSDSDTGSCYSSVSSTAHSETDLIKRLDLLKMEMPSTSEKNRIEPVEITSRKDKVGVVKPVISEIKQKNRVQKVETKTYKAAPMKIFKEVSESSFVEIVTLHYIEIRKLCFGNKTPNNKEKSLVVLSFQEKKLQTNHLPGPNPFESVVCSAPPPFHTLCKDNKASRISIDYSRCYQINLICEVTEIYLAKEQMTFFAGLRKSYSISHFKNTHVWSDRHTEIMIVHLFKAAYAQPTLMITEVHG